MNEQQLAYIALIKTRLVLLGIVFAALGCGCLLLCFFCRKSAWFQAVTRWWADRIREFKSSAARTLPRMLAPGLTAALFSAYYFFRYPPFFNATDSCVLFSWSSVSHFPHWKPGYVLTARAINLLFAGTFNLRMNAAVSREAIYALIALQHLATILGIAFFCATVFKRPGKRLVAAIALSLCPAIFPFTHGVFMVAPLLPIMLVLAALSVRAIRNNRLGAGTALTYGTFASLACLVRHDALIPIMILPTAAFFALVLRRSRQQLLLTFQAVLTVGASVAVTVVGLAVFHWALDIQGSNIIGRAGIYFVIERNWETDVAREQAIRKLQASASDPLVKEAVPLAVNSRHAWVGPYSKIKALLQEKGSQDPGAGADEILTRIFFLYVQNYTGKYLAQTASTIGDYLLPVSPSSPGTILAYTPPLVSTSFLANAPKYEVFKNSRLLESRKEQYLAALSDPLFFVMGCMQLGIILGVLLLRSVQLAMTKRDLDQLALCAGLVFVALTYVVFVSFAQMMVSRLSCIPTLFSYVALLLAFAAPDRPPFDASTEKR